MTGARGLLLLDKPSGPTSHDMVYAVRRGTREKRVGHAGTLDPLATGLLVLCLGSATRLSEYLAGKDKRYRARVRLGQTTTTYDAQGEVVAESAALPARGEAEAALARFRGRQQQAPPQYSAIKRDGQKAYDLARRGEHLELAPRPVEFYLIDLVEWRPPELTLEVHCSAGTYIRSLAHDLGQALGCGAHLAGLRRTASGAFHVEEAVTLAALNEAFASGEWPRLLRPADAALADWPAMRLNEEEARRVRMGQGISPPSPALSPTRGKGDERSRFEAEYARAYNPAGEFIGILRADPAAGLWRPHKIFSEG
jgi:tRNA pseudouridine55 synthase